ncbi:Activating signal cointegrator 1 complex subunit 3 [Bienertia sinuspersici]
MIRSRAMEAKFRRKGSILLTDNYSYIHSTSGELFVSAEKQKQQENSKVEEEMDEFASVNSSFSSCYTPGEQLFRKSVTVKGGHLGSVERRCYCHHCLNLHQNLGRGVKVSERPKVIKTG